MRIIFALVAVLVVAFVVVGCDEGPKPVSALKEGDTVYDMTVCVTNGNNSYIPLNFYHVRADEKAAEVLGVLTAFEKAHPDLEVVSWQIEKQQAAKGASSKIFGIWVHHRKIKLTPEDPK